MKRTLQAMMAFFVVTILLIGTVSAATSQGLEWGVAVSDQWNFDITSTEEGVVGMDEVIYMEVLTRPAIPNIVSVLADIPDLELNITWANGTSLGWSALIFIFLVVASPFFAVPIGNYTLLAELYTADSFYNGTIYDQSGYWGFNLNDFELVPSNISTDIHVDFLKQDGMLAHWTVTSTNTTSSTVLATITMVRQGLPTISSSIIDLILNNILLVGIGVGVIVILGAVVCIRRK